MRITSPLSQAASARAGLRGWLNAPLLQRLALLAVVALAAALRFANLAALGYANHYYAAGVASMLQSWHNFWYVAAEPGGAVSIDKPPVGLWLQAISAYFFGINGFGLLLPQLLAGVLSVVLLYHLVQRWYGRSAGLLAALALALTPVVVATDRNNTMDSTLILTLLLAAWAFIKATETARLRYLLLGALLLGVGFNIKMLQAFLPLPAFYTLYLFGANLGLWRKLAHLALTTLLLLAVSLSWALAVDLTPASERPYVGSSGNNSVITLMLGYNGIERLTGLGAPGAGRMHDGKRTPPRADGGAGAFPPPNGAPGMGNRPGGGGFPGTGVAGPLRLFSTPLSKELSWLLPFAGLAALLLLVRARPRWPLARQHQALVLWGGWLLTGALFFSIAGFFHEYYLAVIAAPLAALVAIGFAEVWRLRTTRPWLASILLLLASGATLAFQLLTAQAFVGLVWWLAISLGVFALGAALLLWAALQRRTPVMRAGFVALAAALLIIPGSWSALTTYNASGNQSLPSAYSGQASGPANAGGLQINQSLLDYLQANTQGVRYLMAVPSSMQGADYVLASGRPVLYLGGFMGQDAVASSADLAQMVADGELRYIYWNQSQRGGFGAGAGNQAEISNWVSSACTVVRGFETTTRNTGAPDGTGGIVADGGPGGFGSGRGDLAVTLYDCVVP